MEQVGQANPHDAVAFFLMVGCAAGICFVVGWAFGFRSGKNDGWKEGYARGCEDILTTPTALEPDRIVEDDEEPFEEEDEEARWR